MSLEDNKELVRKSVEEFYNAKDMSALGRLYTGDYRHHNLPGTDMDIEAFKEFSATGFQAWSDLELTIDDLIAEGDTVIKMWSLTCTHRGDFLGIPANDKQISISGFSKYRIKDGKLAECWELFDTFTMMQQLGVIPASA
jgi:steroid delta-isomerase-like uncharacterized protein